MIIVCVINMMRQLVFLPILSEIVEKNSRPNKFNAPLMDTIVEASFGSRKYNLVIISAKREIIKSPNKVLVRKMIYRNK